MKTDATNQIRYREFLLVAFANKQLNFFRGGLLPFVFESDWKEGKIQK
jgi:hypothetical protein